MRDSFGIVSLQRFQHRRIESCLGAAETLHWPHARGAEHVTLGLLMHGKLSDRRTACGDNDTRCSRPFLTRSPASNHVADSKLASFQLIAPTSSRRCPVSSNIRAKGPNGQPIASQTRQNSRISLLSKMRSRERSSAGCSMPFARSVSSDDFLFWVARPIAQRAYQAEHPIGDNGRSSLDNILKQASDFVVTDFTRATLPQPEKTLSAQLALGLTRRAGPQFWANVLGDEALGDGGGAILRRLLRRLRCGHGGGLTCVFFDRKGVAARNLATYLVSQSRGFGEPDGGGADGQIALLAAIAVAELKLMRRSGAWSDTTRHRSAPERLVFWFQFLYFLGRQHSLHPCNMRRQSGGLGACHRHRRQNEGISGDSW